MTAPNLGFLTEPSLAQGPLAPGWLVFPLAGIALLASATHLIILREHPKKEMPESRRRIRIATGWVIMVTIPISAYAFGASTPDDPGTYTMVWLLLVGLLGVICLLAGLDAANTIRLHRLAARRLHRDVNELTREAKRLASRGASDGSDDHASE